MISQFELRYRLSKKITSQYTNPLKKILYVLLFNFRSWFFDIFYKSFSQETFNALVQRYRDFIENYDLQYEFEYFDCDDFALLFKALSSAWFNNNGVGLAIGLVYKDGKLLGGHAWNLVLINDKIYNFEPQIYELFDGDTTSDGFKYELLAVIW